MGEYLSEQEEFWTGDFGDAYTKRSSGLNENFGNPLALFASILSYTHNITSAIEFGANKGRNLCALRKLIPNVDVAGIEINNKAFGELRKIPDIMAFNQSIIEFEPERTWDFVFTRGVLIHVDPEKLSSVYELMVKSSKRYICVAEYYNPSPVEIDYQGHKRKLFKRDFAGDLLDRYENLRLVKYGFVYHKDPNFPQDDITWFLLEKINVKS